MRSEGLKLTNFRTLTALSQGKAPGPESSISKLVSAVQLQDLSNDGLELEDHYGVLADESLSQLDHLFRQGYLFAPGLRIAGGTDEILRNIIAEQVLGLPQEPRMDKGVPFKDLPRG